MAFNKLYSKKQIQSVEYNILDDAAAGAIGVVRLGIYIPPKCTATGIQINIIEDLHSDTDIATISFGWRTLDGGASSTAIFPATLITTLNTNQRTYLIDTTPLKLNTDWELIMGIAVEALTEGSLVASIHYTEYQL